MRALTASLLMLKNKPSSSETENVNATPWCASAIVLRIYYQQNLKLIGLLYPSNAYKNYVC
jgi:hypothetical protein